MRRSAAHRRRTAAAVVAVVAVGGCARSPEAEPLASVAASPQSSEGRSVLVGSLPGCVPPRRIAMRDLSAQLPSGLRLPLGAGLLQVDTADGMTTVVGESTLGVTELQDDFRRQIVAAGHEIFAEDNEGIEAELFFAVKEGGLATVRERQARCPARTTRFSITVN